MQHLPESGLLDIVALCQNTVQAMKTIINILQHTQKG